MAGIESSITECCERLTAQKQIVTIKKVKLAVQTLGLYSAAEVEAQAHKLPRMISKWRMGKLATERNKAGMHNEEYAASFDVYKALQIPEKTDDKNLQNLQCSSYSLETDLNRYKHASIRANNKVKFLEKKVNSFKGKIRRERLDMIECLRGMLGHYGSN